MVDDHAIVREGLSRIINDTTAINITAEASTGEEAINKINTQIFDLVLLDFTENLMLHIGQIRYCIRDSFNYIQIIISGNKNLQVKNLAYNQNQSHAKNHIFFHFFCDENSIPDFKRK